MCNSFGNDVYVNIRSVSFLPTSQLLLHAVVRFPSAPLREARYTFNKETEGEISHRDKNLQYGHIEKDMLSVGSNKQAFLLPF